MGAVKGQKGIDMIYDELKNISKYRGISANLDTAIAFWKRAY